MASRMLSSAILAAQLAVAPAVLAESLPAWSISEICAHDSAPGQCVHFEAAARNAVIGSWGVLPEATKQACLKASASPLDQSWRLLAGCIESKTEAALAKQAIATRLTPAEPVPPPKPKAPPQAAGAVPLAPFRLPNEAPKIE